MAVYITMLAPSISSLQLYLIVYLKTILPAYCISLYQINIYSCQRCPQIYLSFYVCGNLKLARKEEQLTNAEQHTFAGAENTRSA